MSGTRTKTRRRFFTYNGLRLQQTSFLTAEAHCAGEVVREQYNITLGFRVPGTAAEGCILEVRKHLFAVGHVLRVRGYPPLVVTSQCSLNYTPNCRDEPGGRSYWQCSWGLWARPQNEDELFHEELRKIVRRRGLTTTP